MKSILMEPIERVYQFSYMTDQLKSSAYEKVVPRLQVVSAGRPGSRAPWVGEIRRMEGGG